METPPTPRRPRFALPWVTAALALVCAALLFDGRREVHAEATGARPQATVLRAAFCPGPSAAGAPEVAPARLLGPLGPDAMLEADAARRLIPETSLSATPVSLEAVPMVGAD